MEGTVVAITGAGSGIGRGLAEYFAARGASIAAFDVAEEALRETRVLVEACGVTCYASPLDVSNAVATDRVFSEAISSLGHVDALFANAGVIGPADFVTATPEEWSLVMNVNVLGVVYSCRAIVPHMIERRSGRIIATASYNAFRAGPHVIPYRMSKAAVMMMVRSLSLVTAPYGITVNAISPGVTMTPMQRHHAERTAAEAGVTFEEYVADRTAKIPMNHLTEIADINAIAGFLVSDEARLITGQSIAPDGGVYASS
jgi:NAD(P)-dependent dehydrogenase (short-subunit alcohol dehydrogenase family)